MEPMIVEFQNEAKSLIEEMIEILEEAETDISRQGELEKYGQIVDRIMGGAKSLGDILKSKQMTQIGQCAELCKVVGYKGSQIQNDQQFFTVVVAFLLDATEALLEMVNQVTDDATQNLLDDVLSKTFVDRLRWISDRFKAGLRASVATSADKKEKLTGQDEIDALLKKLGL